MISFKSRVAALAAMACVALLCNSTPSLAWPWSGPQDLGQKTSRIADDDTVVSTEVVAATVPSQGSVTVKETVHYKHSRFLNSDQLYTVITNGSAEYVDRLDYWMMKDTDGHLFRFNKGSTVGIATSKPTVDIGVRTSVMSANDSGFVSAVGAGAIDGSNRTLNVTTKYTHIETYDDATYSVPSTVSATFVELQNAHMAWIGGTLYSADPAGNVKSLREKPTVNVGLRTTPLAANDGSASSQVAVSAGQVSFDGRSRSLIASRDYIHEETFERLRYSMQTIETATYVAEQNAHLAWIGNNLYRVRVGSNSVELLPFKPVVNVGEQIWKLSSSDPMTSVSVIPISLTDSNKSILVNVRRFYRHDENFQVKEYYGQSTDIARYSDTYRVWTVIVDGRIYAIAFDGDVVNDGSVVVVQAPSGLHRPDVVVVQPNGEDPPVVVPTKNRPPVVNNGGDNDDPPVVVPSKRKPPVVINNDDDDGPAVVIPGRH